VPVSIEVYSLDGRLLLQRKMGRQHFGPQQLRWDGRDEVGSLLRPGLYLLAVALEAGAATDRVLRPVGIAY
jgi:flagellar hook assembly protein FlgD